MSFGRFSFVIIAFFICTDYALSGTPVVRDARQFRFGFEPTLTNIPMLLETSKAIVKKAVFGKGEGVLSTDMPVGEMYRKRYMEFFKSECPECVITELYDSHGELTYQITYPDGYYIRASTDAGALEWQTKPSTIPEIQSHTEIHQRDIFDRARRAGIKMRIEATGGHVTFSGFGGDSFWYSNTLKFRAHPQNTDLDWGFFGKDAYNATPVQLWAKEQQQTYLKVHQEHDELWKKFLVDLEKGIKNNATDAELINIYQERKIMSVSELSAKLLPIYDNPKLNNELIGKRSKPKYVANRPFAELIENRAVVPPKNAEQPLKVAKFMEAEAWFIKEQLSEGKELKFTPHSFEPNSRKGAARSARKAIEGVGLKWQDYVEFSKRGDVKLTGDEMEIAAMFEKNQYGAAKRDELYKILRDRFLLKNKLKTQEVAFLCELMEEMSFTIPEAIENMKLLQNKIAWDQLLKPSGADAMIKTAIRIEEKFPAAAKEILAPIQKHLQGFVSRNLLSNSAISNAGMSDVKKVLPLIVDQQSLLKEAIMIHQTEAPTKFPIYAELVIGDARGLDAAEEYFLAINKKLKAGTLTELPMGFNRVASKVSVSKKLNPLVSQTSAGIADWVIAQGESLQKVVGESPELLHWLAQEYPQKRDQIFAPLRKFYLNEIKSNHFGVNNFYKTTVDFDYLYKITPEAEKKQLLEFTMKNVNEKFSGIKRKEDHLIFSEKLEKYRVLALPVEPKKSTCVTRFVSSLKGLLGRDQ